MDIPRSPAPERGDSQASDLVALASPPAPDSVRTRMAPPPVPGSGRPPKAPPSLVPPGGPPGELGLPPGDGGTQQDASNLDRLRHFRVEILGLQQLLEIVASGSSTLPTYAGVIKENVRDIDVLIKTLSFPGYADAVAEIQNTWQLMRVSPLLSNPDKQDPPLDAQTILNQRKIVSEHCKRAIFLIGYLTIPSRLNAWLAQSPRGYYVPFDAVFEDEVPDASDRARILKALAWGRQLDGGLVDVASGLVYKYSTNKWARLGSLGGVVLGLIGLALLIVAIGNGFWLNIVGWPYTPASVPTLIGAWGALLAGIVVHIGVGTAKRAQSQDQLPPMFAPTDFLARIDAQFGFILYKLFLSLIGLFGLVGMLGLQEATAFNAFLAGYSLDSIIELVGSALDRQSGSKIGALKKQLGLAEE